MSKKGKQAEERIKQSIVDGYRRGVNDKNGNNVLDSHGMPVPPPRILNSSAKTYVYRNGKMVEK